MWAVEEGQGSKHVRHMYSLDLYIWPGVCEILLCHVFQCTVDECISCIKAQGASRKNHCTLSINVHLTIISTHCTLGVSVASHCVQGAWPTAPRARRARPRCRSASPAKVAAGSACVVVNPYSRRQGTSYKACQCRRLRYRTLLLTTPSTVRV